MRNPGIKASTRLKLITISRFSVKYRIPTSASAFKTTEAHEATSHGLGKRHRGRQQVHPKLNNPSRLTPRLCARPYLNRIDFPSMAGWSSISSNRPGETLGAKPRRALPINIHRSNSIPKHRYPAPAPAPAAPKPNRPVCPPPRSFPTQSDHRSGRNWARIRRIPHPRPGDQTIHQPAGSSQRRAQPINQTRVSTAGEGAPTWRASTNLLPWRAPRRPLVRLDQAAASRPTPPGLLRPRPRSTKSGEDREGREVKRPGPAEPSEPPTQLRPRAAVASAPKGVSGSRVERGEVNMTGLGRFTLAWPGLPFFFGRLVALGF